MKGVDQYGDNFSLSIQEAPEGEGAGADFDSHDAEVTDWYQRTDEEGDPVDYDYATGTYADGWTPEGETEQDADTMSDAPAEDEVDDRG